MCVSIYSVCCEFVVALMRAVVMRSFLGLHSSRGRVVVRRLGPQRSSAGGVPGGVYERFVWVALSVFLHLNSYLRRLRWWSSVVIV